MKVVFWFSGGTRSVILLSFLVNVVELTGGFGFERILRVGGRNREKSGFCFFNW